MNRDQLEKLYNEKILAFNREPYHFDTLEHADHECKAYNPMCGDKYTIQLVESEGLIKTAYFSGFGCAISKASTSIMMQLIENKRVEEVANQCRDFVTGLTSQDASPPEHELLAILHELKHFEGRIDCIKLSWEALMDNLKS